MGRCNPGDIMSFPTLGGNGISLYDHADDLVAVKIRVEQDRLSILIQNHLAFLFKVGHPSFFFIATVPMFVLSPRPLVFLRTPPFKGEPTASFRLYKICIRPQDISFCILYQHHVSEYAPDRRRCHPIPGPVGQREAWAYIPFHRSLCH